MFKKPHHQKNFCLGQAPLESRPQITTEILQPGYWGID